jgi:hypothetical protein
VDLHSFEESNNESDFLLNLLNEPIKEKKSKYVTTLALGSQPRQGLTRLRAKKGSPGVKENVRE